MSNDEQWSEVVGNCGVSSEIPIQEKECPSQNKKRSIQLFREKKLSTRATELFFDLI